MHSTNRNKKAGITIEELTAAIGVLAFAAVIVFVMIKVKDTGEGIAERNACRESVLLRASTNIPVKGSFIDLECKTFKNTIESSEVDVLKKLIAEQMYWCYWQYGAGKITLLEKEIIETRGPQCFVCNVIEFKNHPSKKTPPIKIKEEIVKHLNNANIPNGNISYSQFFTGQDDYFTIDKIDDEVVTSDSLLVNFRVVKYYDFRSVKTYIFGALALKEREWVDVMSPETAAKECDSIQYFDIIRKDTGERVKEADS